jgi:arylsulfatase A-like enzyme
MILARHLAILFALAAPFATAAASTRTPYEMLRSLPPETFQPLAAQGEPDERGFVGFHRQHNQWFQAGLQRSGCWYLIGGIIANDLPRVERGWTSVEATFAHQIEDGGFLSVQRPGRPAHTFDDRVETAYFYMQELGHALLLLQQSPFEPLFRERIEALKPSIRRAADFILSGYDGIERKVGHTANRLFIASKALGFAGVLLGEERFRQGADGLVGLALTRRDEGGVFYEGGGRDSSYNAVSILMGLALHMHAPDPRIHAAMPQAMEWQLTRILPSGEVLVEGNTRTGTGAERNRQGGIKQPNLREIALALCFYGLIYEEPEVIDLAARVVEYRASRPSDDSEETGFDLQRPNLLLILADDMGYSDLSCYGGEIPTPHLDALAMAGARFTHFYNSARCSPTRAALLTGLYPHEAGMGELAESENRRADPSDGPGYRQVLAPDSVTLAEVLREAGYRTALMGKWHLGYHTEESLPLARGFERFYGMHAGSGSYLRPAAPRGLTRQHQPLPPPDDPGFYLTDAITDESLDFLEEIKDADPFFLFLSFTAPHWPLHAREDDIARFADRYQQGWDQLRVERHARVIELGLVPTDTPLPPRAEGVRPWSSLSPEEQQDLSYRMAVYAAQVYRMDQNIGRVVEALRASGRLDNTLILFLSDNGASAEPGTDTGGGYRSAINDPDARGLGTANPHGGSSYGSGWANASNAPFRGYKSDLLEGGILTPAIVHWPARMGRQSGRLIHTLAHAIDYLPTALEITSIHYPTERQGVATRPFSGRSLQAALRGVTAPRPGQMFWEQYGHRAVREGSWKAVRSNQPEAEWELYDLARDRVELVNRAHEQPEILQRLIADWEQWALAAQVLPRRIEHP